MLINSLFALAALASTSFASPTKREDVKVLAGAPINTLNLTITPDSPVEGGNVTLDWGYGDAGTAPYHVQIGTGGYYANLTWLYEYTNITGTNLTWSVNVTAGETLVFQLRDATNTTTYTQNHKVLPDNGTSTAIPSTNETTSIIDPTTSPSSAPESREEEEEEEESFLGELLADIQSELDG